MSAVLTARVRVGATVAHVLLSRDVDAAGDRLGVRRTGVALAQALARDVLGLRRAALGRAASGKPFLREAPEAGVSVSHSGGWVAAALCATSAEVGVDVQEPRSVSDALVRTCCAEADAERSLAAGGDELARAFASVWVVQEALAKATGEGLRARPFDIPVPLAPDTGTWRGLAWARAAAPVPLAVAVRADAADATWTWAGKLREPA